MAGMSGRPRLGAAVAARMTAAIDAEPGIGTARLAARTGGRAPHPAYAIIFDAGYRCEPDLLPEQYGWLPPADVLARRLRELRQQLSDDLHDRLLGALLAGPSPASRAVERALRLWHLSGA